MFLVLVIYFLIRGNKNINTVSRTVEVSIRIEKNEQKEWRMRKSNPRPPACKADALPTELIPLLMALMSLINKYFLLSSTKKTSKEQNKNIYDCIFY